MKESGKGRRRESTAASPVRMPRAHAVALLALALAGLVVSLYLTYAHYRLRLEPGWRSACAINATVNCDAVIASPYGAVGSTPLSAIGSWYYALAALVAGLDLRRRLPGFPRSRAFVLLVGASGATTLSIGLGAVSAFWLKAFCALCAVLYVVNVAMALVAWRAIRRSGESLRQAMAAERRHWDRHFVAAFAYSAAALAVLAALFPLYSSSAVANSVFCEAGARAAARGDGSAAVTLVMYADFLCPRCRDLDAQLRPFRASHRWSIVHRQYPVESECNPNVKRTSARHRGSCLLARSTICAGILGRYDEFSDGIFDRGPREEQALVELAGSLGLDRAAFETCLRSDQAAKRLAEDIESGREAGVRATPTVVVDGRPHVGTLGAADLVCVRGAPADRPRP